MTNEGKKVELIDKLVNDYSEYLWDYSIEDLQFITKWNVFTYREARRLKEEYKKKGGKIMAIWEFTDYTNKELREIISAVEVLRDYGLGVSAECEDELYREIEKREEGGKVVR